MKPSRLTILCLAFVAPPGLAQAPADNSNLWPAYRDGQGGFRISYRHVLMRPLAAATGRVPPNVPHKVLKPIRNMPAEHFEPLRAGHQLEIALQALVHVRAVHDHSGCCHSKINRVER